MTHPIIVGFDGSEHGRDSLALGRALAQLLDARLIVVHAYTPEALFWAPGTASVADENQRLEVTAAVDQEFSGNQGYELRLVPSPSAAGALQETAAEADAQLIVVGTSHRGKVGRVVLGTVTQAVLDAAPCAVAVAPSGLAGKQPVKLSKIGVGFDDTPEAWGALEVARGLARRAGGSLNIVWAAHLAQRALPLAFAGYLQPNYFEGLRKEIEGRLEHAAAPRDGLDVRSEIASGDTVAALASRSAGFDLIVLGSRGYGPLKRVLLGSISGAVVNEAACPVLVIGRGVKSLDGEYAAGGREQSKPLPATAA